MSRSTLQVWASRVALALVVGLALAGEAHGQCALCRESLRKSGNGGLIQGVYVSILLLTFAPTALMVGIGLLLRRAYVRKVALETQAAVTTSTEPAPCVRT